MRNLFVILSILTGFILSSCHGNDVKQPAAINAGIIIVKFEKNEYAKYVTAYSDHYGGMSSADHVYYVSGLPTIDREKWGEPYIELGDGYFVNRWFWSYDIYPCTFHGVPPIYLLDTMWVDIPQTTEFLSLKTPIITTDPAIEIYLFSYPLLDEFFGTDYKTMMPEKFCKKTPVQYNDSVTFYQDLTEFWSRGTFAGQFTDKDEYFEVCDSIGNLYLNMIKDAFATNRNVLFNAGWNFSDYKYRK